MRCKSVKFFARDVLYRCKGKFERVITMAGKLACNLNLNDMTFIFDKLAINSKKLANQLVNSGLKGDVNPQFINKNMPDVFDKSGKLTTKGKNTILEQIKIFGFDTKATVEDLYNGFLKSINNSPKRK